MGALLQVALVVLYGVSALTGAIVIIILKSTGRMKSDLKTTVGLLLSTLAAIVVIFCIGVPKETPSRKGGLLALLAAIGLALWVGSMALPILRDIPFTNLVEPSTR